MCCQTAEKTKYTRTLMIDEAAAEAEYIVCCCVPSARLTLHPTKLCTKFKILGKKYFFGTKVTSEALLSSTQNLKVTRL
jgi:hypothetical protein